MYIQDKTKEELIKELQELQYENNSLKALYDKDITNRMRAEEALRESKEKYHMLFEGSTLGILATDVETHRFLFSNPAICRMFGYSDEEFLRLTIPDLHPKDSMDLVLSDFESLMRGEKAISSALQCLRKDGTVFYADIAGNSTIINERKCSVGFFVDVTTRKQTEDAVRQSRKELDSLFKASPEMISFIGFDGYFKRLNPAWVKMLGYPMNKLLSLPFIEFVHPDDREATNAEAAKLAKGQRTILFENRYRCIDGSYRWLAWSIIPDTKEKLLYAVARDITERKRTEDALRESELKFRNYIDYAPHGLFVADEMGNYVDVNTAASSITGYSKDELLSMKLSELIPEESMEFSARHFEKVVRDGFATGEFPFIKKDRSIGYWSVDAVKLSDQRFLGFVVDVTKRKQAEETLRESEERFRKIFEESQVGIVIVTLGYRFEKTNPAFCSMMGYTTNELISMTFVDITHPDDIGKDIENIKKLELGEIPFYATEKRYLRKTGEIRWGNITISLIRNNDGTQLYYLGMINDITERKRAELELIIANKELAFQNEEKGKRADELIVANKELAFQNREKEKRADELFLANKELLFQNEEKEKRAAELLVANKELAFQNEEKEKRAAELVIAKEHAEQSDRLKSAFLTNMSHEIRTPMNGILGFSGLLKEPGLTGDQQQEYIRIIEKSGARMLNIINDIVDISKIEAGLMNVNIIETYINEKIESIYLLFKPQVEDKGMQLFFKNTLPAQEAIIRTDNEKVYSILTNLVKNAIKFSEEGAIEFGYIKKGETLEFYVKDTGIGIPKDRQSAIFERFIQADITDKMARQGAGLGLSISKAYVEILGGKIWVESEEGIGSIFYFTLPYNAETEEKKVIGNIVPVQNEKNQIKDLKVLIADDDETSEMLISITVKEFSKGVLKARTGKEAIEICHTNPDLDLILMDIQMPDLNGYEATRQIRQFNKAVVIIAQTAFGLSGDREKAIEAGCNDYMSKPINKDEIRSLIQKYFKK